MIVTWIDEERNGLLAVCIRVGEMHDFAIGGVRTQSYPDRPSMERTGAELAWAMKEKCLVSGLPADGIKIVVRAPPKALRSEAFRALGTWVESQGGAVQTAGDLGTGQADLESMAEETSHVHLNTPELVAGVALTVQNALSVALGTSLETRSNDLLYVVQGLGDIGSSVAQTLVAHGQRVLGWDWSAEARERAKRALGLKSVEHVPLEAQNEPWVWVPCAQGNVLKSAQVWAVPPVVVCGGANCIVESEAAGLEAMESGICVVPDPLSSCGAIIEGISRRVLHCNPEPFYTRVNLSTETILREARAQNIPPGSALKAHCAHILAD